MGHHAVGDSRPAALPVPVAELGEGPHWDAESEALYWVDVPAGLVYRLAEDGTLTSWQAGQPVGAVVPRAGGGLVLTARDGFLALDTSTGEVTPLAPVEADQPGTRMNDGSCDRAGRFYAGTMAADESPGAGSLYRLDTDLQHTRTFDGVGISSRIGWDPDALRRLAGLTARPDGLRPGHRRAGPPALPRHARPGRRRPGRADGGRRRVHLGRRVGRRRAARSEERRVGKECRSRWSPYH